MPAIFAFTILLAIFALGDIVADKTKAVVSTVLVVVVGLLLLFWAGLPPGIIGYSGMGGVGMILVHALIVGIGSNIDIKTLIAQWKTCAIALIGALSGVALIMFVGQFIIGRYEAFIAGPVFSGTNAAILILADVLTQNDMPHLIPFILLVFVTDNLLGIPIASFVLKKEAKLFVQDKELVKKYAVALEEQGERKKLITMPEIFKKPSFVFLRILMVGSLAFWVSGLTGGAVHSLVICLVFGVIATEIGFLEHQSLPKTQSYGIIVFITTVVIFGPLADTSPQMLLALMGPLFITLGLGFVGVLVSSAIISKLLKVSPWMGIAMGTSCSFGMPTTFLMPKEVANAIGTTEEEKAALENYMMPNMVTAGFVSVTIASVFLAQFAATLLFG